MATRQIATEIKSTTSSKRQPPTANPRSDSITAAATPSAPWRLAVAWTASRFPHNVGDPTESADPSRQGEVPQTAAAYVPRSSTENAGFAIARAIQARAFSSRLAADDLAERDLSVLTRSRSPHL